MKYDAYALGIPKFEEIDDGIEFIEARIKNAMYEIGEYDYGRDHHDEYNVVTLANVTTALEAAIAVLEEIGKVA